MSDLDAPRPLVSIRPRAVEDIERHAEYLEANTSPEVALRFRSSIMDAIERIAALPCAGAHREAANPRLSGLRMWIAPDFCNYLIFYLTPQNRIEIVRVFHGVQDINSIIEDEG